MVVRIKVGKLDRQDISFWNDIEGLATVDLLHLNDIIAQSVFPGQLIGLGEVVDLLPILKIVIRGQGWADRRPCDCDVLRGLNMSVAVDLKDDLQKFGFCLD